MGTQPLRFALLLAVLQYAAVQSALPGTLIAELLANGGRYFLKAYENKGYLTGEVNYQDSSVSVEAVSPGDAQHWTIVEINDNQVALRASNGKFLRHDAGNNINLVKVARDWEMWTPVKNSDGTWSFKNIWEPGWLSAHRSNRKVEAVDKNDRCEKWRLEPWHPRDTHIAELLANGGRYFLKAYETKGYLTGQVDYDEGYVSVEAVSPGDAQHFTILQISDTEVAFRAANGMFLRHYNGHKVNLAFPRDDWEAWIPVKNGDGTWSFRSRYHRWLSGHREDRMAEAASHNSRCEKWRLEKWQLANPIMTELLANGGRRILKAYNQKYLIGKVDDHVIDCERNSVEARFEPPGDTSHWTIVQMSDTEVALRASNGRFIEHVSGFGFLHPFAALSPYPESTTMWMPYKNSDGSWGFKSRWNPGWLSAHRSTADDSSCYAYITMADEYKGCEKWWLTTWP